MRRIAVISVTLSILLSSLGQTAIYVHYLLNKNYYETVLCVNKGRPELHCNGKCKLSRELREQSEKEQDFPALVLKKYETVPCYPSTIAYSFVVLGEKKTYTTFYYLDKPQEVTHSVFHPPSA